MKNVVLHIKLCPPNLNLSPQILSQNFVLLIFITIWDIKLQSGKFTVWKRLEIKFPTILVKLVVYSGKFKLFDPHYALVKKFEFALVNHLFDQLGWK